MQHAVYVDVRDARLVSGETWGKKTFHAENPQRLFSVWEWYTLKNEKK